MKGTWLLFKSVKMCGFDSFLYCLLSTCTISRCRQKVFFPKTVCNLDLPTYSSVLSIFKTTGSFVVPQVWLSQVCTLEAWELGRFWTVFAKHIWPCDHFRVWGFLRTKGPQSKMETVYLTLCYCIHSEQLTVRLRLWAWNMKILVCS